MLLLLSILKKLSQCWKEVCVCSWEMALVAGLLQMWALPFSCSGSCGFSSLGSDQRWCLVAVLRCLSQRCVLCWLCTLLCNSWAQPGLDPSSGPWGCEQRPAQHCQVLGSFVLATSKLHLLPSLLSRNSLSFGPGDHTCFKSTLIATSVWQQTLFTICNYLTASLEQTPGTCCYI